MEIKELVDVLKDAGFVQLGENDYQKQLDDGIASVNITPEHTQDKELLNG